RPGPPAFRALRGELRVAGTGRDGLQPHAHRRTSRRGEVHQGQDGDDPGETHQRPGPHRLKRQENPNTPPRSLALASSLGKALHRSERATTTSLKNPPPTAQRHHQENLRGTTTGSEAGSWTVPKGSMLKNSSSAACTRSGSVDQGLVALVFLLIPRHRQGLLGGVGLVGFQ